MTVDILPTPEENTNQDSPLSTLEELKARRKQGLDEISQIEKIIREIEEQIATLACPWKKDTILRNKSGNLYIVDQVYFFDYHDSSWRVSCTRIRKDLLFGASRTFIREAEARSYKVVSGFTVTKEGLVPTHRTRNL